MPSSSAGVSTSYHADGSQPGCPPLKPQKSPEEELEEVQDALRWLRDVQTRAPRQELYDLMQQGIQWRMVREMELLELLERLGKATPGMPC